MRLVFRPYPGITAFFAVLFAILIGLGVWQLQRLQWKLALIDQVQRNMGAKPISLADVDRLGPRAEYRRVAVAGRFDNTKETYIYGIGPDGAPVFHVVVPFNTNGRRTVLVDRGIVPPDKRDPQTRRDGLIEGATNVTGIWRFAEVPGTFTPQADLAKRIWFVRDTAALARADRVELAASGLIEADATPNSGGWPKGGQTQVTFRNEHLQYAVTWFLMAAGLLGVYLAYHRSKGRLVFS